MNIKIPKTQVALHPLIAKRWSPLAFSERRIEKDTMDELFTAASWAASAYNEQPWRYYYAQRGSQSFDDLWSCLAKGNQPWTRDAAILLVACTTISFSANDKINSNASHDLGMANAQLLLQAVHRDIYGHLMAGFDKEKVTQYLNLDANTNVVCVGALGYMGTPEQLEGNYRTRELKARSRNSLDQFVIKL
ncbi:MAG: nitroreductase family protein [Bacteroidota bacterium]